MAAVFSCSQSHMRVICDCSATLKSMTEEARAAVPPHYDPKSRMIQETYNIDGDHFWVETWGVMEARKLLLEMHGPASTMKDPATKRYYVCQHCGFKGQKHRLNLHRHHGLCTGEAVKGTRLKSYPTIPWADTVSSMKTLTACNTAEDVLRMFREVKLRAPKKATDSVATSERTGGASKRLPEFEAQSRPPKNPAVHARATKRALKKPKLQTLAEISDVSSSDSVSGSSARPGAPTGSPVSGDDFDEEDMGRNKRTKLGHGDTARAKDLLQKTREPLQALKEKAEAAEKAAQDAKK